MTRLRLDFAPQRGWTQPYSIVCVVALAGCIHALWWRHDLLQRREQVIGRAQEAFRFAAARDHREASAPPAALNQVFTEMRYPWSDMLDSLQRGTKPGLDLLTLEPDAGAIRRVHISAVANQPQDVFDLIAALEGDHAWSSVQLISQTRNNETGAPRANDAVLSGPPAAPPRNISFSLVAEWGRP
jgi:hypothetical protein